LDKITERAQFDDKDLLSMRRGWEGDPARAKSGESAQIDKTREVLEGFEYGCMPFQLDRTDARLQALDDPMRRRDHRVIAKTGQHLPSARKSCRGEEDTRPEAPADDRTDRDM
jgi:hypothetical protein